MKTVLLSSGIAALLMAAIGCQSTDTGSAIASGDPSNREYASLESKTSLANTSEGDLGPPRPQGNFGNQVGATAWQDPAISAAARDANSSSVAVTSGTNAIGPGSPVAAGPASDLPRMTQDTPVAAKVEASDELFMVNATLAGMYEIEAGKVALRKSESAKIRELANKIINDHTSANNELKRIAQLKNVTLPSELDKGRLEMISKLDGLDKASFDTEFLRQQASAHRDAIAVFDDEARNGKDAQAKAFASQKIPTLQAHLNAVEEPFNTASEK